MTRVEAFWRRLIASRSGSVATVFAITAPLMIGAGAFAVDMGHAYLQRRALQGATDAAALAAASHPDAADAYVRKVLDANGLSAATFAVTLGSQDLDPRTDRDARFRPGTAAGAVRVNASLPSKVYLARIFNAEDLTVSVRSEASVSPIVSLSAGSRLASVNPSIVNGLLKPLLGATIDLKVADYNGLVRSNIELGPLLKSIAGEALMGPDAIVGDVLARTVKLSILLQLASGQLGTSGDKAGAAILRKAALQTARADAELKLGDIIDLDEGVERLTVNYPGAALTARLSALGLFNAAIRQEKIGNVVTASLPVPGLAKADLTVMIGEAQKSARSMAITERAPRISTDQVRLRTHLQTSGVLNLLNVIKLDVPVEVVVAGGTAEVVLATCGSNAARREVKVAVQPGLAKLAIGKFEKDLREASVQDSGKDLKAVDLVDALSLVQAKAKALVPARPQEPVVVTFKGAEIGNGTVKTVKTTGMTQSLAASLIKDIELTVRVVGISLSLGPVTQIVGSLVAGLAGPLDELLDNVLAVAGVGLGEMDVRVDDLVCGHARIIG